MRGAFISFEGIEGTGKTTQSSMLAEYLRKQGLGVIQTAEPGGTAISLKIREMLLSLDNKAMKPVTELLLYNAARVQHIDEVIRPALERGEVVITDRFSDSTVAYQGYGRGIDLTLIDSLDAIATDRLRPDLTILIDLDVETGLRRNRQASKNDRLEAEDVSFHERVRKGFINMAAKEQDRINILDGSVGVDALHKEVIRLVSEYLNSRESEKA